MLARGQSPPQVKSADQAEEIVRIKTDLVQTAVTVLDKQGRFIEGFGKEQFELRVDGQPRSAS